MGERQSRLSSRRAIASFLEEMERSRRVAACGSMVKKRTSVTIRSDCDQPARSSPTDRAGAQRSGHELQRLGEKECVERYGVRTVEQTMYSRAPPRGKGFLLESFPRAEEVGRLPAGHRSIHAELLPGKKDIFHGHVSQGKTSSSGGNVGNVDRPVGRLPSYSHEGKRLHLPLLPNRGQDVLLSGSSLRTEHSTVGVHRSGAPNQGVVNQPCISALPVSRRLATASPIRTSSSEVGSRASQGVRTVGAVSQPEEIRATARSKRRLPGRKTGSSQRDSVPHQRTASRSLSESGGSSGARRHVVRSSGIPPRPPVGNLLDSATGKTAPEKTPATGDSLGPSRPSPPSAGDSDPGSPGRTHMVDRRSQMERRSPIPTPTLRRNRLHGCVDFEVGSGVSRPVVVRRLEEDSPPHQLARTKSRAHSVATSPVPTEKQVRTFSHRQLHSGGLPEEPRRNQVAPSVQAGQQDLEVSLRAEHHNRSRTHSGAAECVGRPSFEGGPGDPLRMDDRRGNIPMDPGAIAMGSSPIRPVRKQVEQTARQLHIAVSRRRSVGSQRPRMRTSGGPELCVSAPVPAIGIPETSAEITEIQDGTPHGLESSGEGGESRQLVPHHQGRVDPSGVTFAPPAALVSPLPQPTGPLAQDSFPGEEQLKSQGFSEGVIQRIQNSRSLSTRKHYKSQWTLFVGWATRKGLDPLNASLPLLAEFLDYLFNERKVAVRTILNYRSAVAFYWRTLRKYDVPEDDPVLRDLIKGFRRERPIPSRHVVEWDIHMVLEFFRSQRFSDTVTLSDRELTLKTVFLLALATGKRRSELHALSANVQWMKGEETGVLLSPLAEFVSKTHIASRGLGALQPITVPSLCGETQTDRLLCPVKTLEQYLQRTSQFRAPTQKRLFISFRRGTIKDISPQTVSCYIKEAILLAYKDSVSSGGSSQIHVKPHSVRHVATSLSALKGFNLEDVLRAGAWASPNMFLKFYAQSYTVDSISKLSKLGGVVAAGTHV